MTKERERILKMVAEGKITVKEAEELLDAIEAGEGVKSSKTGDYNYETKSRKNPKFLRVTVESTQGDNVNVKVPMALLRAGIRFSSVMPKQVYEQVNSHLSEQGIDIDLNNISPEDLNELIETLSEMEVNVDSQSGDKVRVFCE
jgi:DUF4097 and DUF4098 domain-containing protein YvlB